MGRRIVLLAIGIVAVAIMGGPAAAVQIPPVGSVFNIQTSGPNAGLNIGDWYTSNAVGAGNGYHYFALNVPCSWPSGVPIHVDLFDPQINTSYDEVRPTQTLANSDTTSFEIYQPGTPLSLPTQPAPGASGSLFAQTFSPSTGAPTWMRFYTINSPVCGNYILRVHTSNNDDNNWRLRFGWDNDNDPTNTPPTNYNNPDGLSGTGDELAIGIAQTTYQHESSQTPVPCLTLYQYVAPGQASITFHNFDVDGGAPTNTVTYIAPNGATYSGTLSGNAVWNNGTVARGGDTIANPLPGWWSIVTCITPNNQFIQEGQQGAFSFFSLPPTPDMTIAKTDNQNVTAPGQTLTYAITFTNQSNTTQTTPGAAFNVVITDTLPAGTTFVSCSLGVLAGTCTHANGVVTFTLTNPVVAGASGTVYVTVTVNSNVVSPATLTNTATISYTDQFNFQYPPAQATDTTTVPAQPQLTLSKSDGTSVTGPGQTLTYTLTFTNTGVGAVHNLTLSDTLPPGVTYQGCSAGALGGTCSHSNGVVTFALATPLGPGQSASVTVTATVTTGGPATLTNTATLTYTDSANQALSPVNASDTTTVPAQPQLTLSKSDGTSVTGPGQTLTYTLTFTDTGVGAAHNLTLSDTLPPGVTYQGCSAGALGGTCSHSNGVVTFALATPLGPGQSASVTVAATVTTGGPATLTNTATLTYTDSANQALSPVNASDTTTVPQSPPSALVLTAFHITPIPEGWEIRWSTGWEQETRGFLIYRSRGEREQATVLTDTLIPARGNAATGAQYTFIDRTATPGVRYAYWLVEVETTGAVHEYGPFSVYGAARTAHQIYIPFLAR